MGIIKQGILGGFLGKVGGVVGGNFKGIATMRAMPLSVANPRTAAQVGNRTRFSLVTTLATMLGVSFLRTYWNRGAVKMSGFNAFCSTNKDSYNSAGLFYPMVTLMSNGSLTPPVLQSASMNHALGVFNSTVSYPVTGDHLSTDIMNIVLVSGAGEFAFVSEDFPATQNEIAFDVPEDIGGIGDNVFCYAVSRRADGSAVSSTFYTAITIVS
jgi:hypothetical protein